MRNPPGIVQHVVDLQKIAREARKLNVEIRDGEALVERESSALKQRREQLAKKLIEGRKGFNDRGDGFVKWVEGEVGIPFNTALRYMKDAGYVPPKKTGAGGKSSNHHQTGDDPAKAEEPAVEVIRNEMEPRKRDRMIAGAARELGVDVSIIRNAMRSASK